METLDTLAAHGRSNMPNQEDLETLLFGVKTWNEWREQEPEKQPDLSGIDLPEADLSMANLGGANLRGADLHGADLSGANLSGADLGGANLRGAVLRGADLNWVSLRDADLAEADLSEALLADANLNNADMTHTDLSGADLHGANLRGANLANAQLGGANFEEAAVAFAKFADADLESAKGLAKAKYFAPSAAGVDVSYRNKGGVPLALLRGAGIPHHIVGFINALPPKRPQPYSYFILHGDKDTRFCDRLYVDLQAYGVRSWYFPDDGMKGKRFFADLVVRVKMFDRVIAVCSRNSLQNARFVEELARAVKRESEEKKHVLFVVRLDNYILKEWTHGLKMEIIDHVAADFRGWTRSVTNYDGALKSLLIALRTN